MDSRLLVLGALGLLAGGSALTRGSRGVVRRGRSVSGRKDAMPNVRKGERYESIGRSSGEPQTWQIDLKHSLWSQEDAVWAEYAPMVWRAIWDGIVEGKIEEYNEGLTIKTTGQKTNRSGTVIFRPHGDEGWVEVDVWFGTLEGEEDVAFEDAFTVTGDEDGFDEAMRRIDAVEERVIAGESA